MAYFVLNFYLAMTQTWLLGGRHTSFAEIIEGIANYWARFGKRLPNPATDDGQDSLLFVALAVTRKPTGRSKRAPSADAAGGAVCHLTSCSESGGDVGLLEILALEEERLPDDLGERIGKAVAEIQPGRMAALAEVEEGLAQEMRLFDGERFDDDVSSAEKDVTLTAGVWPNLAFNDDGEFQGSLRRSSGSGQRRG
jgi:hypothetical protein